MGLFFNYNAGSGDFSRKQSREEQLGKLMGQEAPKVMTSGSMTSNEFDEAGHPTAYHSAVQPESISFDHNAASGYLGSEQTPEDLAIFAGGLANANFGPVEQRTILEPLMQEQSAFNRLMNTTQSYNQRGAGFQYKDKNTGKLYYGAPTFNRQTGDAGVALTDLNGNPVSDQNVIDNLEQTGMMGMTSDERIPYEGEKSRTIAQQKQLAKNEENAAEMWRNSESQVGKYNQAIDAIDSGADTGWFENWFPSVKDSTLALENLGNQLALGLLSTVTMGALSKSEMDILQATAMPQGMQEDDLRSWLEKRRDAEQKVSNLYLEAAQSYSRGESKTEFYNRKKTEYKSSQGVQGESYKARKKRLLGE